jgi:2-keto-4-pentenoate hydratase/2-oxohepta-3-ene-1,7-dioic acid hydratase in catechol pathway
MYLLNFQLGDGKKQIGVRLEGGKVLNLTQAYPKESYFEDMIQLIESGKDAMELITQAVENKEKMSSVILDEENIRILAPIPRPRKNIYCIGLNYQEHSEEWTGNKDIAKVPVIFSKSPLTVIGPDADIEAHVQLTNELDYEAEMAVVIGKKGRDIPADQAFDYIFGYTMINDVTARDLQRAHQQWMRGKSLDTFCPMGPYLIHKSVVPNPHNLDISCYVNGERRQFSNTSNLIFDIPTLIETISAGHTLEAGDIIATGTCAGVGMSFNPPRYLKSGDIVEVKVEGFGVLRNRIV